MKLTVDEVDKGSKVKSQSYEPQGGTSCKATLGRELMALRTDRTTRIPSGVASPVAAKGSVFVKLSQGCRQLKQMAGLRKAPCLNGSEVVAVFQTKRP